nr:phospholipase-like, aminotransferase-like mobile domain protein [Tanacetum cinerariifolium]
MVGECGVGNGVHWWRRVEKVVLGKRSDDDNFDLPLIYDVNGHSLHFGRRQFCLLAGFKFGSISFREYRNGDIPFCNRLFPEKIGDEDAIRLCLLLFLEVIFMGRDLVSVVDDVYLRMVNDLDAWNLFPWEVKSLRGRIHKLESIIQSTFYPSRVVEKQKTLKKFVPQSEDYLQSTSEDEPDIKDHTSPKVDDGNVYCCDDNGDVPLFFMPAKPDSQQTDQDLSSDLSHYKYTYSSKQEDQIIWLVDQRRPDHISNMAEVAEQKIQSEIQRLYNHREARLNKIAEEDKQRKCLWHMNTSAHMKLAIECCVPKKRKYVDVVRTVVGHCKFLWCNDITVHRSFWNVLSALDDNRKGWLLDEHIDLWVTYFGSPDIPISIRLPLLLQGSMRFFMLTMIYTRYHGVMLSGERTEGGEYHKWYLQMRDCLEEKIPMVLKETGVFEKKNIDPAKYKISFQVRLL